MGCFQSKEESVRTGGIAKEQEVAHLKKLVWKSEQPMTRAELQVCGPSCDLM